ncbi:MAG: hypothetical protein IPK00_02965 [Deltaproteobacteria bacterium]|nr:hypothetical protein [Deltaproteobacteria bacterium]
MELGRSAWIRRERLERIATAERDRRAGRHAVAIAALGEAEEWPARAVLALCLLPEGEGAHARRVLEEGLDQWALESGLEPLTAVDGLRTVDGLESDDLLVDVEELAAFDGREVVDPLELSLRIEAPGPLPAMSSASEAAPRTNAEAPSDAFHAFQIELDRPIEAGELERAFAEAEAQVDEMHDVNRVAESVLFDAPFEGTDLIEEELDPLEESARVALAKARPRPMDAASVPSSSAARARASADDAPSAVRSGRPSQAMVLATLERWLQNLERSRRERM